MYSPFQSLLITYYFRLERNGVLMRLDENILPTRFRFATVSPGELQRLRRVRNIVRRGRGGRPGPGQHHLPVRGENGAARGDAGGRLLQEFHQLASPKENIRWRPNQSSVRHAPSSRFVLHLSTNVMLSYTNCVNCRDDHENHHGDGAKVPR